MLKESIQRHRSKGFRSSLNIKDVVQSQKGLSEMWKRTYSQDHTISNPAPHKDSFVSPQHFSISQNHDSLPANTQE